MDTHTTERPQRIERDEEMNRDYIPLAGGYEWQTKGSGSTTRLLCPDGQRHPISEVPHVLAAIEAMVRAQHAALNGMQPDVTGENPSQSDIAAIQLAESAVEAATGELVEALEKIQRLANEAINTRTWKCILDIKALTDAALTKAAQGAPTLQEEEK